MSADFLLVCSLANTACAIVNIMTTLIFIIVSWLHVFFLVVAARSLLHVLVVVAVNYYFQHFHDSVQTTDLSSLWSCPRVTVFEYLLPHRRMHKLLERMIQSTLQHLSSTMATLSQSFWRCAKRRKLANVFLCKRSCSCFTAQPLFLTHA